MRKIQIALLVFCTSYTISAQCWLPVWADEFNGTSLDLTKWEPQVGAGGWGNNELQYYTARPENIEVSGGSLKIIARAETYNGSSFTSARLRTLNRADFAYGKFEAEIKLPEGQGIWPAYWMLPSETHYGIWPAGGEIDIMEYLGHQTTTSYHTIHSGTPISSSSTTYVLPTGSFSSTFHVFTAEWEPNVIRFYVDGTLVSTKTPANVTAPAQWRFDRIFHQILNLAVGGNWPGAPNTSTQFPATMEVRYARVYQKIQTLAITGASQVQPNSLNKTYTLPNFTGTYLWSVPAGATITSGQGTNQINVDFGTVSGNVSCAITSACGSETRILPVSVTSNLLQNFSFEDQLASWTTSACCGSVATYGITTNQNAPNGASAMCANVTGVGANSWNTQFFQATPNIESGVAYTLSFQAKCDAPHPIAAALWRPSGTVIYHPFSSIGTNWSQYSYNFTPVFSMPAGAMQLNFDVGAAVGQYCFDQVSLAKTASLPVELLDFQAIPQTNGNLMRWTTAREVQVNRYDIERSTDSSLFEKIGETPAQNQAAQYTFLDAQPPAAAVLYYRLKVVNLDGSVSFSHIISLKNTSSVSEVQLYPNPAHTEFTLELAQVKYDALVEVFDVTGRLMASTNFSGKAAIDSRSWPIGIYYVVVKYGDREERLRFVKW
jgi:beta-glucanase (GH16 family)